MEYKKIDGKYIIEWCQANNQVEWLKAEGAKKVTVEVYPLIEKDGKMVEDKTQAPTLETRPISFIELKKAFVTKFMPDVLPKKKEKDVPFFKLIQTL